MLRNTDQTKCSTLNNIRYEDIELCCERNKFHNILSCHISDMKKYAFIVNCGLFFSTVFIGSSPLFAFK